MIAVGVVEHGGPEALRLVELPDPSPGSGQVRIRVHAAAVSPTDLGVRNGAKAADQRAVGPPPYVPGMDAAGVLAEIGPDVETDLEVGDHVMAIVVPKGTRGAYAEQVVVPIESVARVPHGFTDVEACTLPMNGLTARLALDTLDLAPGSTLVVTGAAGVLGGCAVQLAALDGLRVVADASDADRATVESFGADTVLARGPDFASRVRTVVPDGVDGAVDAALLHDAIAPAVRDGGTIVTVRGYEHGGERGIVFRPIWVSTYSRAAAALDDLRQLAEEGRIAVRVAGTVPKERAAEAHERMEAGGVRGRWVIEL